MKLNPYIFYNKLSDVGNKTCPDNYEERLITIGLDVPKYTTLVCF